MSEKYMIPKQINDDTVTIAVPQNLDNNNAHELAAAIANSSKKGYTNLILDLAQTSFISSAGVGSILGTVELFREVGGDIYLCNASATVIHVFEVLDLTDYLTIKKNNEEAFAACCG